jgi:antitoxin HicB
MATRLDYPFQVRPLTDEEGGGYLIEFRDLPGCLSDGETIEDAIRNGPDAVRSWIETAREFGDPVPPPSRASDEAYSGHWNMRVPKSLPRRLAERAKAAGVSLNTLAVTLLAEGWAGAGATAINRRRDRPQCAGRRPVSWSCTTAACVASAPCARPATRRSAA